MKAKTLSAPTLDEFKVLLRNKNLKATPQRVAVHESMLSIGHASADMTVGYARSNLELKRSVMNNIYDKD